jgi:hypothetical protein
VQHPPHQLQPQRQLYEPGDVAARNGPDKERQLRAEAEWVIERAVIRRMCHVLVVLCSSDDTFDPVHHVLHIETDNAALRSALDNASRETGMWGLAANSVRELVLDETEQAAAHLLGVRWRIVERRLTDCLAEPSSAAAPGC